MLASPAAYKRLHYLNLLANQRAEASKDAVGNRAGLAGTNGATIQRCGSDNFCSRTRQEALICAQHIKAVHHLLDAGNA